MECVRKVTWESRIKWIDIGLALGMDYNQLDCIKTEKRESPKECFTQMFAELLNDKEVTWTDIATALAKKTVGHKQLADKIEYVLRSLRHNITSAENKSSSLTRKEISRDDSLRATGLGSSILTNKGDAESVAVKFECPCSKCTLDEYLYEGCPEHSSSYPYIKLSGLSKEDRDILIDKLKFDTDEIREKFADLCNNLTDSLKDQGITVNKLVRTIGFYEKSLRSKLTDKSEIDTIFTDLQEHVSFFNYATIAYIAKRLGSDDDKKNVKMYEEALKKFCERRIFEVSPRAYGSKSVTDRKRFAVLASKLDLFCPVSEVEKVQSKIAKIVKINPTDLNVECVNEGCIMLVLSVSIVKAQQIFPLKPQTLFELKAAGFVVFIPRELANIQPEPHKVYDSIIISEKNQLHRLT